MVALGSRFNAQGQVSSDGGKPYCFPLSGKWAYMVGKNLNRMVCRSIREDASSIIREQITRKPAEMTYFPRSPPASWSGPGFCNSSSTRAAEDQRVCSQGKKSTWFKAGTCDDQGICQKDANRKRKKRCSKTGAETAYVAVLSEEGSAIKTRNQKFIHRVFVDRDSSVSLWSCDCL